MPLDKLDLWLQSRTRATATNLSMLDGFVTAVVAEPVSMDPPERICPLLGIDVDAFNHGGTPEFAAISAVAVRHAAIVETLTNGHVYFTLVADTTRLISSVAKCQLRKSASTGSMYVTGKQLLGPQISYDQRPLGRVPPLPANQPDGPAGVS
jgi:hypothetical protein